MASKVRRIWRRTWRRRVRSSMRFPVAKVLRSIFNPLGFFAAPRAASGAGATPSRTGGGGGPERRRRGRPSKPQSPTPRARGILEEQRVHNLRVFQEPVTGRADDSRLPQPREDGGCPRQTKRPQFVRWRRLLQRTDHKVAVHAACSVFAPLLRTPLRRDVGRTAPDAAPAVDARMETLGRIQGVVDRRGRGDRRGRYRSAFG